MDLRGLANSVSSTVNPNTQVSVRRSTGYTLGSGARQVPTYAAAVTGPANIQALSSDDIKQLDGLNIQGTLRAFRGLRLLRQRFRSLEPSDWIAV